MALVAEMGDSFFFPTGSTLSFVAPSDGTLVVYVNDDKADDNAGAGDVTITVTPK